MINESIIQSHTNQAKVVMLEDHIGTAESMQNILVRNGKVVQIAKSLAEFESLIKSDSADVGSVDWDVGGRFVGSDALSFLKKYQPNTGKLVYSVHIGESKVEQEAKRNGADFLLEKDVFDYAPYADEVEKAAKLGLFRQIAEILNEENIINNTSKTISFPVEIKAERDLYTESRKSVFDKLLKGIDTRLTSLLKRRGWWELFDANAYSNLSMNEKLILIFKYVDGKTDDFANILRIDNSFAKKILDNISDAEINQTNIREEIDKFISVLAYILRLSDYEPELMPHFWKQSNIFKKSLSPPPWDTQGLCEYLKYNGITGINQALFWIRNH